jgi:Flavoprotein/Cyclic nucleotide-binding domain
VANILLVATGGTRAPTQVELAERFLAGGHAVRFVSSGNALRFLSAYLVRNPRKILPYLRRYRPAARETMAYYRRKPRSVPHISEGKWADVAVLAPATCNSVGKLASGLSDNYPLQVLRALPRTKRVIVVPSMNPEMWYDPLYQRAVDVLNATEKYRVLCPTRGQMLSGDWGFGAQVPLDDIVAETYRVLGILDPRTDALLTGARAGAVPWDEEHSAAIRDARQSARVALVERDEEANGVLARALRQAYPDLDIQPFRTAATARGWLETNLVSLLLCDLDGENAAEAFELFERLRRPGREPVQLIATSARDRRDAGAERLGRMDILFLPKPLNVPFAVGMIGGALRAGARDRTALVLRVLTAGEILFREGEASGEVYLLRSGGLRISAQRGGACVELGEVAPGSLVGEMAFLNEAPRAATVIAVEPSEVAVLDLESMRSYLQGQPAWLQLILRSMTDHLRSTSARIRT